MKKTWKRPLAVLVIAITVLIVACLLAFTSMRAETQNAQAEEGYYRNYLSEFTPIQKNIGYGVLHTNGNMNDDTISYIVDGKRTYFNQGFTAHANSTLVFDIGENHHYDYFTAYLGVDASQGGKGDVKISVYTSTDKSSWITVLAPTRQTSSSEAIHLTVSVDQVRYLKFYFDSNGGTGNDHSGMGAPLLYSANALHEYDSLIHPVEYFDDILTETSSTTYTELLEDKEQLLLQRALIENANYDELKENFLCGEDESKRREMLTWLWNDTRALKDFIAGGEPDGSYIGTLTVLTELYQNYKEDLTDTTDLFEPEVGSTRKRGDVYRTMMIAIALTHAGGGPHMWLDGKVTSDPVERYAVYKLTYLDEVNHLRNDVFENLNVEEMRYVMGGRMHNDEVYWLNAYVREKTPSGTYPGIYSPHRFLRYGKDWDYSGKGYLTESNFAQYDEKYNLTENGLDFSPNPHLWMVFEGSHICWGISYTGANFANVFGVPAHYNRQDGHAAFFVYNKDGQNRTTWSIDNNITGWTATWLHEDVVGYSQDRMLCNWGTIGNGWSSFYNATYIVLASTALDHIEEYEQAEILMSLEKYAIANEEEESLYREVLSVLPYHLDAWEKLCRYYAKNKTAEEISSLAQEVAENMYYFPLPMHDLLTILKNALSKDETQLAQVNNIERIYLLKGSACNTDPSALSLLAQTGICQTEANYLLGSVSTAIASFSFDGENQNKIVFGSQYAGVRFVYSLDGGNNWSDTKYTTEGNLSYLLTAEEISSITAEKDILIWLEGWASESGNPEAEKAFCIDIKAGSAVSNLQANDNENRFFGTFTSLEYSVNGGENWTNLTAESRFTGNDTVLVRKKPFGTTLQGLTATYTFTQNNTTDRVYITIDRESIHSFSSEEASTGDNAVHVIDGLTSTRWHTIWKGGDSARYITIKIDSPVYLTGLDYTPSSANANGTASAFDIYVSLDGENFYKAFSKSGLGTSGAKKSVTFDPVYCQYVKFVGVNTVGGFCSARLIELFEDKTMTEQEITGIEIATPPTKTEYFLNQTLNTSGLKVNLVLSGAGKVTLPLTEITLLPVDMTSAGEKQVTVQYQSYSTSFAITVRTIEDCAAVIGIVGYDTLASAFADAKAGDEIDLMKDILLDSGISVTKKVTLSGNGYSVKRASTIKGSAMFSIGNGGDLTIEDITIDGGADWTGEIHPQLQRGYETNGFSTTATMIYMTGNGKLTVNSGILKNNFNRATVTANTGGAIYANGTASITFNSGEIRDCYSELFGSAIYFRDNTSLVFNDGTIRGCSGSTQWNTTPLCADNNAVCTVNGGTFQYNYSAEKGGVFWVSNGRLTINGGRFVDNISTNGAGVFVNGTARVEINDFDAMQEIYLTAGRKIILSTALSGKILPIRSATQTNGTALADYTDESLAKSLVLALQYAGKMIYASDLTIKITDISQASVCLERSEKESYFSTFGEIMDILADNDTVTLLADIPLTEDVVIEKAVTIECGAFTFVGGGLPVPKTGHDKVIEGDMIVFSDHIHEFTEPTFTWSEDKRSCTAERCCACGECETETVDAVQEITQTKSCTQVELSSFTASFLTTAFIEQRVENIQTAEMTAHVFENATYTWSDDYLSCTAEATCSCGEKLTETADGVFVLVQEFSCLADERKTFTATFENSVFEVQEIANTVTQTANGHTLQAVEGKEPTEREEGIKAHEECIVCHKTFIDGKETTDLSIPCLQPENNDGSVWLFVGIGAGAFVFLLILIIAIAKKRR